jgi:predicted dehydrogenase
MSVFYADDTRWKNAPEWAKEENLKGYEDYLDKADPADFPVYNNLIPDIVFVVTPDFTHCELARRWLRKRAPLVFVEKPFDSQLKNVEALFNARGRDPVTSVLGLDHYQFRAHHIHEILPEITQHLDGALAEVHFYMTETQPLEWERRRTLQYGLTLDMLPHLLALLTFFGDLRSVHDIQVLEAGRYGPEFKAKGKDEEGKEIEQDVSEQFYNETYSKVSFTFEDYSGNGYRVPCMAVVGKGFGRAVRYLEVTGRNGNAIRVEFSGAPNPNPSPVYPWASIMFLLGSDSPNVPGMRVVDDPYLPGRKLRISPNKGPVERSREKYYQNLIEDLVNGRSTTLGNTLLPDEAEQIVRVLDSIWWAIQEFRKKRGWSEIVFQQTDPMTL